MKWLEDLKGEVSEELSIFARHMIDEVHRGVQTVEQAAGRLAHKAGVEMDVLHPALQSAVDAESKARAEAKAVLEARAPEAIAAENAATGKLEALYDAAALAVHKGEKDLAAIAAELKMSEADVAREIVQRVRALVDKEQKG